MAQERRKSLETQAHRAAILERREDDLKRQVAEKTERISDLIDKIAVREGGWCDSEGGRVGQGGREGGREVEWDSEEERVAQRGRWGGGGQDERIMELINLKDSGEWEGETEGVEWDRGTWELVAQTGGREVG